MPSEEFYSAPLGTRGNVLLNWEAHAPGQIANFASAYWNAAQTLCCSIEQQEMIEVAHRAYPLLFLYRHAIELYLKCMAYRIARLSLGDEELQKNLPSLWREHSLLGLLEICKPVLHAMGDRLPPAHQCFDPDDLQLFADLDRLDSGSYSFRYPVTSRGAPSLPPNLRLNIFVFAQQADRALDSLRMRCRYFLDQVHALDGQFRLDLSHLRTKTTS
jgi:hypothetical protein